MSRRLPSAPVNPQRSVNQSVGGPLSSASSASQAAPRIVATHQADAAQSQPISSSTSTGPSTIYISPHMLSRDELYDVYLAAQKEISDLKAEIQHLRAKNANSELKFVSKTKVRAGKTNTDPPTEEAEASVRLWSELKAIARHYQLFTTPFFEPELLSLSRPDFPSDSPIRYTTTQNQTLGKVAELYELVPDKFHYLMSVAQTTRADAKSFIGMFNKSAGGARSTSISLIRTLASGIFDIEAKYFTSEKSKRIESPKVRELIGYRVDADGTVSYQLWPPVLCRNGDTVNAEARFLNPSLFKVARAVIFGKTTAHAAELAVAKSSSNYLRFTPEDTVSTTFGLIAWTSIMVRYALSLDGMFTSSGVGATSHIAYQHDFDYYKRYLIQAKNASPRLIKKLLDQWDEELFSAYNQSRNADEDAEKIDIDDDSEIAREMEQLRLAESQQEDDELAPTPTDDRR